MSGMPKDTCGPFDRLLDALYAARAQIYSFLGQFLALPIRIIDSDFRIHIAGLTFPVKTSHKSPIEGSDGKNTTILS